MKEVHREKRQKSVKKIEVQSFKKEEQLCHESVQFKIEKKVPMNFYDTGASFKNLVQYTPFNIVEPSLEKVAPI